MNEEAETVEQKNVRVRQITKILPVQLTDKEMQTAGSEQAEALHELADTEGEAKRAADDYKGRMKEKKAVIIRLMDLIRAGKEHREVKCEEERDFTDGVMKITRKDTGEIVEARALRADERQLQLLETPEAEDAEGEDDPDFGLAPPDAMEKAEPKAQKTSTTSSKGITDEDLCLAVEAIRETSRAATSVVQRRCRFGFVKASKLIEELSRQGFLGQANGTSPREILKELPEVGMAKIVPME